MKFLDEQPGYQHNLVTQVGPNPEDDLMYSHDRALLFMLQINEK